MDLIFVIDYPDTKPPISSPYSSTHPLPIFSNILSPDLRLHSVSNTPCPQERAWQKEQGKPVGPTLLFFGCRNRAQDYIYQEELEAWQEDGLLTLHVAFSRDQVNNLTLTQTCFIHI